MRLRIAMTVVFGLIACGGVAVIAAGGGRSATDSAHRVDADAALERARGPAASVPVSSEPARAIDQPAHRSTVLPLEDRTLGTHDERRPPLTERAPPAPPRIATDPEPRGPDDPADFQLVR